MANDKSITRKRKALLEATVPAVEEDEFELAAELSSDDDTADGTDLEDADADDGGVDLGSEVSEDEESDEGSDFEDDDQASFSDVEGDDASLTSLDTKGERQGGRAKNGQKTEEQNGEGEGDGEGKDTPNYTITTDANGGVRYVYRDIDAVYDSDDTDAQEPANTIGNIPLSFYDSYPHIGYDINGKKIMRPATGEALDALLDTIEVPKGWTGLTDPATGKPLQLSQDELELLRRIQMNEVPEDGYDPYPEMVEYFTGIEEKMPLNAAPEPKRRFLPSKHEAKRIAKLVRAIREGRILPYKPPEEREREEAEREEAEAYYDLWQDEQERPPHVMHIPAPKLPPPGFDLSYNPPPEYLPTAKEKEEWEKADPEDRNKEYLPQGYDSLRKVPGYGPMVKERFERCLDLYLAPRVRRNRLNVDPASMLPKLPRPEELRPFPTTCACVFRGHEGPVRSVGIDPSGTWLASGGDDGTVRVWDLHTGRQVWSVRLTPGKGASNGGGARADDQGGVKAVRWRPGRTAFVLAAAAGDDIYFMVPQVPALRAGVDPELDAESRRVLDAGFGYAAGRKDKEKPLTTADGQRKDPPGKWSRPSSQALQAAGVLIQVTLRSPPRTIAWHGAGSYLVSVSSQARRSAVALHSLPKHATSLPIRRAAGIPEAAAFHPSRPHLFVASRQIVRVYDLQRQEQARPALQPGARWIAGIDVHPASGDHVLLPCYDRRLLWHDLDASSRPYRTMRFHAAAVRCARFHRAPGGTVPLLADGSDDGTVQVYHAKVVADSMEAPTIVPVKTLRGHVVKDALGVMDLDWHPRQPFLVTGGGDGTARLWM